MLPMLPDILHLTYEAIHNCNIYSYTLSLYISFEKAGNKGNKSRNLVNIGVSDVFRGNKAGNSKVTKVTNEVTVLICNIIRLLLF